jgi:hypothetical protein
VQRSEPAEEGDFEGEAVIVVGVIGGIRLFYIIESSEHFMRMSFSTATPVITYRDSVCTNALGLVQLRILSLGLLQYGDVGVGVLP